HEVALTFNDSHDKGQPSCAAGPPTANFESHKIVGSNPERVDSGRAPVEYSCQPTGPATGIQLFLQIHWYLLSEIREEAWRYGNPYRIENGGKIDDFLRDGSSDRRQVAECCCEHSEYAQCHSSNCGLQSDMKHASRNMDKLIDAG